MAYTSDDVKRLRKETNCSLSACKEAFDYAEKHEGCKPIGYLRARLFGRNHNESFEDAVKRWSKE